MNYYKYNGQVINHDNVTRYSVSRQGYQWCLYVYFRGGGYHLLKSSSNRDGCDSLRDAILKGDYNV